MDLIADKEAAMAFQNSHDYAEIAAERKADAVMVRGRKPRQKIKAIAVWAPTWAPQWSAP